LKRKNENNKSSVILGFLELSPWAVDIFKVYLGDILSTVIGGLTVWLLIRGLSVDDYASYTAFTTIMTLVPGLVGNGINLALIRFSAEYLSKTGRKPFELYVLNFLFQIAIYGAIATLLFSFSSGVGGFLFGSLSSGPVLQYGLLAGLGYLFIQASMSIFKAEERFGVYIKLLWANKILLFFVIGIFSITKSLHFTLVAKCLILVNIAFGLVISYLGMKGITLKVIPSLIKKHVSTCREFLLSTGWLIGYYLVLTLFQKFDIFLLSRLSSQKELAVYGVAFQYYSILLILLGSITTVLAPKFSRIEMQDPAVQRRFVFKWLKSTAWIILPILIADLLGKPLFVRINGAQYAKSFSIFVIFSISVWLSLMFSPLMNVLVARKEFRFIFSLAALTLVINFVGNFFLIPHLGGRGAALVLIFSHNIIIQGGLFMRIMKGKSQQCA